MSATAAESVSTMLGARSVAVVGASPRPGSFGERMVTEVLRSTGLRDVTLVNPGYDRIGELPCHASLQSLDHSPDLVLLGVADERLEDALADAAAVHARSAVVFGSAHSDGARARLSEIAISSGMALCGAGCMGFLNLADGVRALGYLEREDLRSGAVSLITHSGSVFSTMLRTGNRIGYNLAISSGQELVTTTADYVDHITERGQTRVLALVMETLREGPRLRESLHRLRCTGTEVVVLATGGSDAGSRMVAAHSGAIAGDFATWDALCDDIGAIRATDLAEFTDILEVLSSPRRTQHVNGTGLATVHDSGAERSMLVDLADHAGVHFAEISSTTTALLAEQLDPGLEPTNPLDIWGTGHSAHEVFRACLTALSDDPLVAVTALAVDLVEEYDGDTSYPDAVIDAAAATSEPIVVLSNLASSIDTGTATRLRAAGIPVLEGSRSGLRAIETLLSAPERGRYARERPDPPAMDTERRDRWCDRLDTGAPLTTSEIVQLLDDYRIPHPTTHVADDLAGAVAAADVCGWPVVLKTADPTIAHKSEVGGVVVDIVDEQELTLAYRTMAEQLGPQVAVQSLAAPGVELSIGILFGGLLGPVIVVAAGGILVEILRDSVTALPPLDRPRARWLLDQLRIRPLLNGYRGAPAVDVDRLCDLLIAVTAMALELDGHAHTIEFNPVIAGPTALTAVDALITAPQEKPSCSN